MNKIFNLKDIFAIPNIISMIRITLIPVIIQTYCVQHDYLFSSFIIAVSCLTDILDGIIARKFNMITNFGKIIDPVADKLTKFTIIICLSTRFEWMKNLIVVFILKELLMSIGAIMVFKRKNVVNSSLWHGKMNTVILYITIVTLIVIPNINNKVANILIVISICSMISSCVLYLCSYRKQINNKNF